ncbi:MAG: hypothetical protein HY303_22015 [Candidatus Wallbacteria bacterium]|nr:hypothetical protein [Candidatus Wallbacteria bacterium]
MFARNSAVRTLLVSLALAAVTAAPVPAAGGGKDPVAKELDHAATQVLEDAAGRPDAFGPRDKGFVESLDEFAATAHDFASKSRGDKRDVPMVRKLSQLADRVSSALVLANVPPNISSLWNQTRRLVDDLRTRHAMKSEESEAGKHNVAREQEVPGDSIEKSARDLHRAADELLASVSSEPGRGDPRREALRFKLRYLAQHAQAVDEAANSGGAPDSGLDGAVARCDFYSERVEQAVGELGPTRGMREAHEAFLDCLDRVHDAIKAARSERGGPARPHRAKAAKAAKAKRKPKTP